MKKFIKALCFAMLISGLNVYAENIPATTGNGIIQMSELDLSKITFFNDDGRTAVRANKDTYGGTLSLKGNTYESGVGTHADSKAVIKLNGATKFHAIAGVGDSADLIDGEGEVDHVITLYSGSINGATQVSSTFLTRKDDTVDVIDLDVAGYDYLVLHFQYGENTWSDHCVWADARFEYSGEAPATCTESDMYAAGTIELPASGPNGEEIIPLSSLNGFEYIENGWGTLQKDKSIDGNTLTVKGLRYASGIGAHASGKMVIQLNGTALSFHAVLGIDDETGGEGNCNYSVKLRKLNGEESVVSSGSISGNPAEKAVNIDIENLPDYRYLIIEFPEGADGDSYDHVDIANAYFQWEYHNSSLPEFVSTKVLETGLDCATVLFSQPGVRFMHRLRSSNPDLEISVRDLPSGLKFNQQRCLVEGIIQEEGVYSYSAITTDPDGNEVITPISLTVSSDLDQPTPWMGWLSWNVVQGDISQAVVETVADAFISQGLLDAGYNVLAIDDLWHADQRHSDGRPAEDLNKFPQGMKAAADYVHSKGLKFGIYSDAGTHTCAGRFGSLGYEEIDARQYAEWGVDLVKYDYCFNAGEDVETAIRTYKAMGDAIKASGRKMIFYVCEWGVREPWKWGTEVGGSCWRTTYDVRDCWLGIQPGVGFVQSMQGMKDIWAYSGVNRFNDADMLCTGINGQGKSSSDLCATGPGMTKDEYRTQFAMWCMWSSPLALTFDLRNPISDIDKAIMTNAELIAIDQDRMGQQAEFIGEFPGNMYLFAKDLENGDVAVSVTNMSDAAGSFTIDFADIPALDREATYYVRDLQAHQDMPNASGEIVIDRIKKHETIVYRLSLNEQDGIASVITDAVSRMTANVSDSEITICIPGSGDSNKRILLSDLKGHIVANASGTNECFTLPKPEVPGIYIINCSAAGYSHSLKITI